MTYGYLIAKYLYTAYYLLSIANLQGDGEGKHEHRNSIRMESEQEGTISYPISQAILTYSMEQSPS